VKYNIWKKKEDLENIKEAAVEFEVRLSAKTREVRHGKGKKL